MKDRTLLYCLSAAASAVITVAVIAQLNQANHFAILVLILVVHATTIPLAMRVARIARQDKEETMNHLQEFRQVKDAVDNLQEKIRVPTTAHLTASGEGILLEISMQNYGGWGTDTLSTVLPTSHLIDVLREADPAFDAVMKLGETLSQNDKAVAE